MSLISRLLQPFAFVRALARLKMGDAGHNYRLCHRLYTRGMAGAARKLETVNRFLTGADISCSAEIGEGLALPHSGGVVIGGLCVIGRNCVIYQQVTLGYRGDHDRSDGQPHVGNDVMVGAGAKILGPVKIGDGAVVGANAVVVSDVPAGALAVGIPAQVKEGAGAGMLGPTEK